MNPQISFPSLFTDQNNISCAWGHVGKINVLESGWNVKHTIRRSLDMLIFKDSKAS
jgi:hypothetical protein